MYKITLASLSLALGTMGALSARAQSAAEKMYDNSKDGKMASTTTPRFADYAGEWQGTLHTPEGTRRVALDVGRRTNGDGLVATLVTSAQLPYSVLVDKFEIQERHVRLEMKTAGTAFEGTSNRAMTEIKGTWKQAGNSMPLTLKRVVLNTLGNTGDAYESRNQVARSSNSNTSLDNNEHTSNPTHHRDPAFRIGPPHWFSWYEWVPPIGNQQVPYGTYYW